MKGQSMRNEISTPALVAIVAVVVLLVAGLGWFYLSRDSAHAIREMPKGTAASMPGTRGGRGGAARMLGAPALSKTD